MSCLSNCATCQYKTLDEDYNKQNGLHCYMFKDEPDGICGQWKGVNVGTIGHIGHVGNALLLAALKSLGKINAS